MATNFYDAFSQALPQGLQLGMQQQQIDMQRQARKAQMIGQANETLQSILKLPPGPMRKYSLGLARQQWEGAGGQQLPDDFWGMMEKTSDQEYDAFKTAAQQMGLSQEQSMVALTNPKMFADVMTSGLEMQREKNLAEQLYGPQPSSPSTMSSAPTEGIGMGQPAAFNLGQSGESQGQIPSEGATRLPPVQVTDTPLGDAPTGGELERVKMDIRDLEGRIKKVRMSGVKEERLGEAYKRLERLHSRRAKLEDRQEALMQMKSTNPREAYAAEMFQTPYGQLDSSQMAQVNRRIQQEELAGKKAGAASVRVNLNNMIGRENAAGERKDIAGMRTEIQQIDSVLKGLDDPEINKIYGKLASSPGAVVRRAGEEYFGGVLTEEQTTHRAQMTEIASSLLSRLIGAAQTEGEAKRLAPLYPKDSDSIATLKGKLKTIKQKSERLLGNTEDVIQQSGHTTPGRTPVPDFGATKKAPMVGAAPNPTPTQPAGPIEVAPGITIEEVK